MLRISTCLPTKIVDKPVTDRAPRAATAVIACGRRARACLHGSKRRGQSLSDQALGRGMRRLSTRLPTKSVDKRRRARDRRRFALRDDARAVLCRSPVAPSPAVCRIRSGADKTFRIKRLIALCAGYPHACQQNLWVSGGRHASGVVRRRAPAWHRDAMCGEPAHLTAHCVPRLHHACQSPSDQGLSVVVRRISTSLPTFSVENFAIAIGQHGTACHSCAARGLMQCKCPPRRPSETNAGSRRRTTDRPTASRRTRDA